MPHIDTSKSQATNRASYNASYRYQKITGHLANKSYILPCPMLIPANHSQQVVHLTMPHTDTCKSQATNRTSCHASHRYQQITGNKSYILPCLTQIPANTRSKSCFLPCFTQVPANHRQQIVLLAMPHTDTTKSQATNLLSCHASHRYHQITGNKSYILPCLTQVPVNHRQQIVHLTMPHTSARKSQATNRKSCHASHRCEQITGNKPYILPCLTQTPANHRQQIVYLTVALIPANDSQQVVLLVLPHADNSKSQATNHKSCHASHRYQQVTGNRSYILPCLTETPASHRQQIVHPTMPHTDTSKSQASNRQQIVLLTMPHTDTSKSHATNTTSCHALHG